jgi:diguanylate cyclase (GGDEF)-like protein
MTTVVSRPRSWIALLGKLIMRRRCPGCTLIAAVLVLSAVIVAWLAIDLQNRYRDAISDARTRSGQFADVLAEHTARTFEGVERALDEADKIRRLYDAGVLASGREAEDELRRITQSSPVIVAIGWTNRDGDLIVQSRDTGTSRGNIGNLPYFVAQRDNEDGGLLVAQPYVSLLTGEWVTSASRRLTTPEGEFAGIIRVVLDPSYFSSTYRSIVSREDAIVLLAHRSGPILVREPYDPSSVGNTVKVAPFLNEQLPNADAGSFDSVSPLTGQARIAGYRAVRNLPLVILVSYARAEVLAPWYRHMYVNGSVAALELIIIVLGTVLLARRTNALVRAKQNIEDANTRFGVATSHMNQGLALFDANHRLIMCSERYASLYGLTLAQIRPGITLEEICALRLERGVYSGSFPDGYFSERPEEAAFSRIDELSDGRFILIQCNPTADGGWVTTHEDVTDRQRLEQQAAAQAVRLRRQEESLRVQNMRFKAALEHMGDGLCMFDAEEKLVVCNDRFGRMYRLPPELFQVGAPYRDIVAYQVKAGVLAGDTTEVAAQRKIEALGQLPRDAPTSRIEELANGKLIRVSRQPLEGGGGWVATHEDVTDRHHHEARISFMAHHDLLTGLPNRAFFTEKMEDAVARYRRHNEPFSVFMLDLDKFKNVNDSLGHPAGDHLLKETAQRLMSSLRETDVLARLGGDEFAIIQAGEDDPHAGAAGLAGRIARIISEPYDIDGKTVFVGTSIGIALASTKACDSTTLLKMADLALYRAKSEGRNGYRFFEPDLLARSDTRRHLEAELRAAIAREEFELHYQPLIDVNTRRAAGFEALVRWRHPVRGLLLPGEFIPLAEETGLIEPLGEWILQRACTDAVTWPTHLKLAVNISPVQLAQPDLLQVVLCALVESSLAPERLELEITETALFDARVDYVKLIRRLKSTGVAIALDDFGTGYSSLSYLTMFPFDKIKIDRSFTLNLMEQSDCAAIVSAVLALGHGLDIETVAEGVETEQQFGILRAAGVTFVQGTLFGAPLPAAALVLDGAEAAGRVHSAA